MWPVILELGPIKLYSFGLMAAMSLLFGSYFLKRETDRYGLGEGVWNNYAVAALIGGFAGAKINFLVTHRELWGPGILREMFSGAGLVWFGGFIGGVLACFLLSRRYKHDFGVLSDAFAPALVVAYLLGRIGCFVSGDGDYGGPTDVPWAMAFPNGIVPTLEKVHPTPLYEIAIMSVVFAILWKTRTRDWARWSHFGLYLLLAGAERFTIEFWRTNAPGLFGLTTAQQISVVMILVGTYLFLTRHTRAKRTT